MAHPNPYGLSPKRLRQACFIEEYFQADFDEHQLELNADVQAYFDEYGSKEQFFYYLCCDLAIDYDQLPKNLQDSMR